MPVCVPIKDMRDTAKFSELVEREPGPITVTKNGYDQFVVMRSSDYDELLRMEAKNRIMERMLVAERERAEDKSLNLHDALASLRKRYGA